MADTPKTPAQCRWYQSGYQQALRDVREALSAHGAAGVEAWLDDNLPAYEVSVTWETPASK
jgi:hypothetical protein